MTIYGYYATGKGADKNSVNIKCHAGLPRLDHGQSMDDFDHFTGTTYLYADYREYLRAPGRYIYGTACATVMDCAHSGNAQQRVQIIETAGAVLDDCIELTRLIREGLIAPVGPEQVPQVKENPPPPPPPPLPAKKWSLHEAFTAMCLAIANHFDSRTACRNGGAN